jgi:KDO2-lipid IV(A) lauroyltransferase
MVFFKLVTLIFGILPSPIIMLLARLAHPIFYRAMKKGKWGLRARKILPKVFPGRDLSWYDDILKRNALHLMKFAGEVLKMKYWPKRFYDRMIYFCEGQDYFEDLFNDGKGLIILTCHLGNWEYGAEFIAYSYKKEIYAPVFVMNSVGNRALNWMREGHDVVLLEARRDPKTSARTFFQMRDLLKSGEIIYLVADQQALGGDMKGKLFGKEIRVFGGPFILAEKTHKPVLPFYTLRDEKNRIALYFEEPFYIECGELARGIERAMRFFERVIAQHPEQYLWSQDRW